MMRWAVALRRRLAWNQALVDVVIAVFLTIGSLLAVYDLVPRLGVRSVPMDALGLVLLSLQTVPLAFRQRHPTAVLAIIGSAITVYNLLGYLPGAGGIAVVFALYSVAANTDRRTALTAAAITTIGIAVSIAGSAMAGNVRQEDLLVTAIANYVIYATAWILGDNVRVRRAYTASLEARAAMLERERGEHARLAVVEERARIARELHDVVAHHVSVMVVQAAAARRILVRDPAQATEALDVVETTGREALAEMRRMLGVLRSDESSDDLAPQPSLERLDALLDQVRDAGLRVQLLVEGDARPLPPGIDLNAYRIVQEALTNVLKHAGSARATVRIRYGQRHLELEITDDGRGAAAAILRAPGGGQGLIGMRERAKLHGGGVRAGPRKEGGYRVMARLRIDGPDRTPAAASPTATPPTATSPTATSATSTVSSPLDPAPDHLS
jgi:signal transduction histidine kinase